MSRSDTSLSGARSKGGVINCGVQEPLQGRANTPTRRQLKYLASEMFYSLEISVPQF
jgi:hypothetical protein